MALLLFVLIVTFGFVHSVESKRDSKIDFGVKQTLNVFPSEVHTSQWAGVEQVLVQDLSNDALYQDFSARNSAYVPQANLLLPEQSLGTNTDEVDYEKTTNLNSSSTDSSVDNNVEALLKTPVSEEFIESKSNSPEPDESDESTGDDAESEVSPIDTESEESAFLFDDSKFHLSGIFPLTDRLFPLAQLTITSTTDSILSEIETDNVIEESNVITLPEQMFMIVPEFNSHDDEEELEQFLPAVASTTEMEEENESVLKDEENVHEIVLSDFETALLERGQFISGMQLRLSLAAQLDVPATGTIPYIEVLFGDSKSIESVGVIMLDDEISNALNGGYFLFALPTISDISSLSDSQVVVRYHGDSDKLDGMFLDAAWLELDTMTVTNDDLKQRGVAEQLQHLKSPEMSTLVSDQVNFGRDEEPIFNLRYNSQRNFLIRSLRKLVGSDLVAIESVIVKHQSFGMLGIVPELTVTADGLLTIEIPKQQLEKMRPGSYEIEIILNEGGKVSTDTFSFQWGILSMNPNKSEYQVGETAHISVGALTPYGHTICKANLDLYVTDPNGFVSKYLVEESGLCDGNNIIDVPDFSALVPVSDSGLYELYLERLDDDGSVLGFTTDTFNAVLAQDISIERHGPTRIYPPASYPMVLTVSTTKSFIGTLTEIVPASFEVYNTNAEILSDGVWQWLTWDISILGEGVESVSYEFDAPDISPYLFNLGPARLDKDVNDINQSVVTSSSTATSTQAEQMSPNVFIEHRRWQIASDAVGKMLLLWADGSSVPTNWTCVSCTGGDPFYQRFIMGSSTYNTTGGSATHGHTAAGSVIASTAATTETGSGTIAPVSHSHSYTPTIANASSLPAYRQLRVIRYDLAAGAPGTLPAGAIAIFDVASSSLPSGWNRYGAQDGKYVYGENTPATTGGSNTHTHAISGTTGASSASTRNRGGGAALGALAHTHTVSGSTASDNNEPSYLEVLLAQIPAGGSLPTGMIAMWDQDVDTGWLDISSSPSDAFSNVFFKPSTTYGGTGGGDTHTPSDVTGLTSGAPSAVSAGNQPAGSAGASGVHTHSVDVTGFSSGSNLPPYITVVFGKLQGSNPVYEQVSSLWYVNSISLQTPSDEWPSGATNLVEREPITATSTPVKYGDEVRLRINVGVTNATSSAGATFKLQFAEADTCSAATSWADVGDVSSSTVWRGYNNSGVTDHSTLSSQLLASTTVSATYEENGYATTTPSDIPADDFGEWDFVLQHNGATPGVNYCFQMVEGDGTNFSTYSHYPRLYTNESPSMPTLDKLFDNEKTASTSPWFYFYSTDAEGETIHYEIEIDNNYNFSSPVEGRDTISDSPQFENQTLLSDKAPFIQGNQIKFIPASTLATGTTYYWRVRGQDPDGSTEWGSWSTIQSFTIDTTLTASAWFQTEDEQFDTNTLSGVETGSDEVDLITGSSTGTMTSSQIDFDAGELGTAWDSLTFNDTETAGDIKYQIQYLDITDTWTLIPDADLPSNSTGFDTSPVSLLGLDTDTYNEIRILANLTNSGGTPSLQNWTINWGYRVETPTIAKLFPNEQTGTTTPTFQFTTTDPQNDDLTYQVQWSLTPDFAASTTRTSDDSPPSGFVNIDNGFNTDPFDSGDDISFTIQPADVLTGTTTYWWRVRAKDTTGDDAWSFWTDEQSFTVIPGTQVSTWLQTSEEQFDADILSGTAALGNDSVSVATTATEAMVVYGEGTETAPRYRQWDGSAWGSEDNMQDVGASIKWAVVKAAVNREEYVAVTVGTDADVNAQVFSTGVWDDLQEVTVSMGNINARGFDVVYETLSGDAMVAYCDGDADPSYYIWDGSTWTSGGTINLASTNNCEWIKLASDPTSDEIILMARDSDGTGAASYEVQVWSGSGWGNSSTQGGSRNTAYETMALNYEEGGGQAISISGDGNPVRFEYNIWSGSWAGVTTNSTISDNLIWAELTRDVGTDNMAMCYIDESSNVGAIRWTGSAWTGQTDLDTPSNAITDKAVSCVYETNSSRNGDIMVVYSDATNARYRIWDDSATSWLSESSVSTITDSSSIQSIRTGNGTIMALFFDDVNDSLDFSSWTGSWSSAETLENDMSVGSSPFGEPFMMAPRNSGLEGTTIVSPPVDFDDGTGPYWDTFSWNDSTPGSSQILYHLQYFTSTSSWEFIPDSVLPNNVAGTTTGPFDLSGLNTSTYNIIRPYAEFTCDNPSSCPSINDWKIEWAGGITISGTIKQYDQSTNVTSGSVGVAVNGVLQTGKVGSISGGNWSIDNVTVLDGDIVTIFVDSAGSANEAVGVTRYDGQGDMDGINMFERHLSLGSNDATTTVLTNADIGQYDVNNTEDVFIDLNGTMLEVCGDAGCSDAEIYIKAGTYYSPTGRLITHDFENNGTFTAGSYTHEINGSWDNNATTTMTGSTLVFAATSTTESIDSTGAISSNFNSVTFGTTTGNAVWTLVSTLDVDGNLTVTRGTLSRGATPITIAGNLGTGANGFWTGVATTTFDGSVAKTWQDQNGTLQNIGYVVVDGTTKTISLAGNVAAETITIGANDTLDASATGYDITVYGNWYNQNNFLPRTGEVFFAATSTGKNITTAGDAFYDITFNGIGGGWSFTGSTLLINNDFTVSTGTVNMPTATTTIVGSFDATGGSFAPNNGIMYFTSSAAEAITFDGDLFTNVANNLTFNGGGSWTITDTNATTTNDVIILQGTVNLPSGVFAIGGRLADNGGAFVGGVGTVTFYSTMAEIITAGGSSFGSLNFNGSGSWTFSDTNVDANGDLIVANGTLTLPTGNLTVGGSYENFDTVASGSGLITFDSTDAGEFINFGSSSLYDVVFNNTTGGWTISNSATTTNNFTITNANDWTLNSGTILSVGGDFTNSVGGASTTWTGSTLALESGSYNINTKANNGDVYETIDVAANTDIKMWNSAASTYAINSSGSLYSQDHNAMNGDLYIFGNYVNTGGNEFWSYSTDFDGTSLTGTERQVDVRLASGASVDFVNSVVSIVGDNTASTTIANQGSGTYIINISGGTTTANYYEFVDLGSSGLSLLDSTVVSSLNDGYYEVAVNSGSALTISSTTIDANPSKQIFGVSFATTTAIGATNVTQTDGTPASYWWFRDGVGNLYGENYDNDTGDPGSIRFDDSSLELDISGTVYSDAGITPIAGGTCDGSTPVIRVMVDGVFSTTTSCSNIDGSYTAYGVVIVGDPTVTVYLNGSSGGEKGSVVTRTLTSDITNMDIYANRVIVRNEDTEALTIENMAVYDFNDDPDIQFFASTTTNPDSLTVLSGNELFVFATSTFAPGGDITLSGEAAANSYDGTLYIDNDAVLTGNATNTYTIGGRFVLDTGATFSAASTTVLMNATTTGKSITSTSEITFYNLSFDGVGGGWNLGGDVRVLADMTIATGTVTGTENITIPNGSLGGDGVLSLGGGTTTLESTNNLGGTSDWIFYNLQLGDGIDVGTTTPLFVGTTIVSGRLTISAAHYLDSSSTQWDLSGTGTVFVEDGTFIENTSTIRYSGNGANVLSTQYYNLDINAGAGTPTYTATGMGIIVDGNLTIGGDATSTFNLNTIDPDLDVNGDVIIRPNGILSSSNSGLFTIAGNYDNNGTLTSNAGTITFDGAGTTNIAAGTSNFGSVLVDGTGDVTITEHATATNLFTLSDADTFTLASGESLAVGGTFYNDIGGADTTWTGSTLRLYGGNNYAINAKTVIDTYETLDINDTTQIKMWDSDAGTYDVATTASLYSQDHENNDGDLYIWGAYKKTAGSDYWSHAIDFDGTSLSGVERKVDVYFASGASVKIIGGSLGVYGASSASTTIQNQGSGTYNLTVGGNASSTFKYYEVRDVNSSGLTFTGNAKVATLSYGDLEVSQNGGTAITVGGTVITANPAKNFNRNRFALNGVGSGFNVTATGTSISSWRFANHYGDIDGESFDVDPDGNPGYVTWVDSANLITISGNVYSDEVSTVSGVCDGSTQNIALKVGGITSSSTSCDGGTGAYNFSGISYGPTNSLIVYIDNSTASGSTVTKEPISNINNLDIFEDRVIVRHENVDPISIADMAVWDSSDDGDIPFTAINAGTDTLTLPANYKLIVWEDKEFEPAGNVTISGGGAGAAYDGTVQLYDDAIWTGQGTESLSIGGSFILGNDSIFTASNGTTTFTTTGAARTIDVNENLFNNVSFIGSGSWSVSDPTLSLTGNFSQTAGVLTLPAGTTTVSGSFVASGGSFVANSGLLILDGTGTEGITLGGSDASEILFTGGDYIFGDVDATSTATVTVESGDLKLPSGTFAVGGDFLVTGGTLTNNTNELILTSTGVALLQASTSDLYSVTFNGGGVYSFVDTDVSLLDTLTISSGTVILASGTTAIGGSFAASGGLFDNATGTILFNSADGGETIDSGNSDFYSVQISAPTGGYTIVANATTTDNFSITSANSFTLQSGVVLVVNGVFLNSVGGANTTWTGSTLLLDGANEYSVNNKVSGEDQYETLIVGANSDISFWNSAATSTTVDQSSSIYSQDHDGTNGALYIYGDLHISTSTKYWSYATDFDGTSLTGVERVVTVFHEQYATTTVDGGSLQIVGSIGNETTITNQGSGTYGMEISDGVLNAQYYAFRNLNADGLSFSGSPTITSLSYGDYELAVSGGSLITLSSTTLNTNASLVITGNNFATTSAITGYNVNLVGTTSNAWTFTSHSGNIDGEDYDSDGATDCGSIRWNDSSCLLTQQTNYRWRNDDGGLGVPDTEWYNANWDARKRVRLQNQDATTYTDPAVQIFVTYDSDMQSDFDDLRFTSDDGTTIIPHWIGSTTASAIAEVWVKVPTLLMNDTTSIYMYYNNPTATSSSSSTDTFIAADDFEDGNITEYTGQTGLFAVDGSFAFDGSSGLDNTGNENGRTTTGGIRRLDQNVSLGETFRFKQYVVSTSSDETCTLFGSQAANQNYAVCFKLPGADRISLVEDAHDNDTTSPATTLGSVSVTFTKGWYEVEVDWSMTEMFVSVYDSTGALFATTSGTSTSYTSGGIGFTYWFNNGGWDSVSSRQTLETEPAVLFGDEQSNGGASWAAAQNTYATFSTNDIARLRLVVENTGLSITNQQFLLEYAPQASAPSCEAVAAVNYTAVPVQASCGTSPVCMQSSTNVTNGVPTFDLLNLDENTFTAGEARQNPSNITGNIDVDQNQYTELEYVITPTSNIVDESLCFRVTDNGTDYDTYLSIAKLNLRFDPTLGTVVLNNFDDIVLIPGATTTVYATGTVTDLNGYADLVYASSTIYRSGVAGGAACTADNNNCYKSSSPTSCQFTDCSGNSCTVECSADIYFHADPTDLGSAYDGEEWQVFIEVEDSSAGYDFASAALGVDVGTLRAIDVTGDIDYGSLAVNDDTGSYNASTSVINEGNVEADLEITGTDLSDGLSSVIPAPQQKFATSTFTYSSCGASCALLSSTTPVNIDVDLSKPSTDSPPVEDDVFWGIAVPFGVSSAAHQGINVFTPVSP